MAASQAGRSGHMVHRAQPRVSPRAGFQERIRAAFSEKKSSRVQNLPADSASFHALFYCRMAESADSVIFTTYLVYFPTYLANG